MKILIKIVLFVGVFSLLFSCEKERINSSSDALLKFSADSITFDTIFTSIGSTTKNLRIVNPSSGMLIISSIRLNGGEDSGFRLNVNGEATNEAFDVEIPPNDSIYIFVEVTLGENGGNIPMVAEDSITFQTNGNVQSVNLMAWGQDFTLIRSKILQTETLTNEKPYLIYDYAYVDSAHTLTIEPGTIIHFHDGAGLYVKGNIVVEGTEEAPVVFQGDRLEPMYHDVPDQWNGIILFSGSHNNLFNYAQIRNANIGLQVGTIEHEGFASVEIGNTLIENMSWSGIWAMKSKIVAHNLVVSNVRYYNTALLLGGDYQFYHSTFANYYRSISSSVRTTETLIVSNYLVDSKSDIRYVGDLTQAVFGNCIVSGDRRNELLISMDEKGESNYFFDHCMLQLADTFKIEDKNHYTEILRSVNPRFLDPYNGKFELDTLSAMKDAGRLDYAKLYPFDYYEVSRLVDDGPDLGAFERVEKDIDEEEE